MKKPNHISLVFPRLCLALLAGAAVAATNPAVTPTGAPADMPLQLTPEAISKDKQVIEVNMARWFFGANLIQQDKSGNLQRIVFANRDQSPYSTLLDDDITSSVKLPAGDTRIVIDIGGTRTFTRFGFYSFSANGSVDLYSSTASELLKTLDPTNKQVWTPVNAHTDFAARQPLEVKLGSLEARYVMVVIHLAQAGEIGPLALFGTTSVSSLDDIAPDQDEQTDANKQKKVVNENDLIEFDYANRAFGSKVTHVAGGDVKEAQSVLTSDPVKKLTLGGPAEDTTTTGQKPKLNNVFVVDMGKERNISKVGLLFSTSGPGKFEFYFLNALPTKDDAAAKTAALERARNAPPILMAAASGSFAEALILSQLPPNVSQVQYLPDNFFDQNKPGITQDVTSDSSRVAQTFDNTLKFQFALVRWVPNSPDQPAVEILRVNLIGKVPPDNFFAASKKGSAAASLPSFATPTVTPITALTAPSTPNTTPGTGSGGGGGTGGGGGSPPEPPPTPQPTNPVSP